LVFDQIRQLALDPEHLPVQPAPEDDRSRVIKAEIIKVESQISKAMDLYLLDSISKSVVEDKLKALNDKKLTMESELEQIGQSVKERLTKDQTVAAVHNFDDVLSRGNFDEIRTVIGQLIRKIEIDGEDITIYWNF
jgi:site-specific DNA recombinase